VKEEETEEEEEEEEQKKRRKRGGGLTRNASALSWLERILDLITFSTTHSESPNASPLQHKSKEAKIATSPIIDGGEEGGGANKPPTEGSSRIANERKEKREREKRNIYIHIVSLMKSKSKEGRGQGWGDEKREGMVRGESE